MTRNYPQGNQSCFICLPIYLSHLPLPLKEHNDRRSISGYQGGKLEWSYTDTIHTMPCTLLSRLYAWCGSWNSFLIQLDVQARKHELRLSNLTWKTGGALRTKFLFFIWDNLVMEWRYTISSVQMNVAWMLLRYIQDLSYQGIIKVTYLTLHVMHTTSFRDLDLAGFGQLTCIM